MGENPRKYWQWQLTKVRNKKEVISETRNQAKQYLLLPWWIFVIWRTRSWNPNFKSFKVELYSEVTFVKDDSGSYAVFTEQGSSASQMTAATVMDVISRLPGCAGQAADAVSACTRVKMEDAPSFFTIPKSKFPDIWIRLPTHKWPNSWYSMEDPVVLLERNLCGHPLARLLWERQFEKVLFQRGWEKVPNVDCLFLNREKGLFLSVYVDDMKLSGKKQNIDPMWKVLMKDVDLGEPTSILDHVFLGCPQREVKHAKIP